jgi:hypothetical protein
MKFYFLGTIGGLMNSEYASCMPAEAKDFYTHNSFAWWKWGKVCPNCGVNVQRPIVPYQMQWLEGNEIIGDFAGSGKYCWHLLIQQKVADFFTQNNYFAYYKNVSFISYTPLKKSKYPIVPLPYVGMSFYAVLPQYGVCLNDEKSQIDRKLSCSVCGHIQYNIWKTNDFWSNLIIDEEEWNGLKMFGLFEFGKFLEPSSGVFLSEEGYDLLKKQGFTNWQCKEVGRIEKAGHSKMLPYREKSSYDFWKPEEYVEPSPQKKRTRKSVTKQNKPQTN